MGKEIALPACGLHADRSFASRNDGRSMGFIYTLKVNNPKAGPFPVWFYLDFSVFLSYVVISRRAGIAQLVEYKLPKLGVASSNLVARSRGI